MVKTLSVMGESPLASEAARMSAPNVWALEAALVIREEDAIRNALEPLGRTLTEDFERTSARTNGVRG